MRSRIIGKQEGNFFVKDRGTHYSNLDLGIRSEINRL